MDRKHIHKHKKKNNRNLKAGLKRLFSPRFFIILGVLFLLTGIYFSLTSSEGPNNLYEIIMNFFKPSVDEPIIFMQGTGFGILLLYFLPAALVLVPSFFYIRRYSSITYIISLIVTIYLIVIQSYMFIISFLGICYYSNLFIATLFLLLSTLLLLLTAFLHRKYALIILCCFYFFISAELYATSYIIPFEFLFLFIFVFSTAITWIGRKIERPAINFINFGFSFVFFSFFFLRKFVINSKTEYLIVYLIFSTLFYILFYAIVLFSSNANQKPLPKWMQWVLTWTNVLFFLGSMSFILLKYYTYTHLCIFVPALLLFNVLVLLLVKKYVPAARLLPNYYICVFLAALVLPLWVQQSQVFLFTAGFSVFMFLYATGFKDRVALWVSRTATAVAFCLYLFFWITAYIPAIVVSNFLPEGSLLWNGVMTGIVMLVILSVTKGRLEKKKGSGSKKSLVLNNYNQFISLLLFISFFLTSGWIVFALLCQLTGTIGYTTIGWFITGSLFFILLIRQYAGKQSEFKKPLLYMGFVVALLYPLLWGFNVQGGNFIHTINLNGTAILLHYLAVISGIVLGAMTVRRIYQRNTKYVFLKQGVQIVSVVYLAFFLCTEYNNLNIVIAWLENSSNSTAISGITIQAFNQYIPYSILLGVLSVVVFVFAFFRHKPFLRGCALVLFVGTLIKVFAYDFPQLAPEEKSAVFIVLGIFLIVFALLYPVMVKVKNKNRPPSPLKGE